MEKFPLFTNKRFFFTLFFLLFFSFSLQSAERIARIDFVGLVKTEASSLKGRLSSKEGAFYSQKSASQDVKALFATGLFEDVSVSREGGAGGIRLVFHVVEKGTIGAITFRGNRKVKKKDLENALTIREFNQIDEGKISESVRAIKKLYEEKDYSLVEVGWHLDPLDSENNEYELVFDIQENRGVKIRRIAFVGNKAFSDKKLAKQMRTKVKGFLSFINKSGKLDDDVLQSDTDLLYYFYLNKGYLKAKIGKPQVSLTRNNRALNITIPVFEGVPYKISSVDVAGDIMTTREELLSQLELKAGETYSRMKQDQDTMTLGSIYGDQAYAFASVVPRITTNDEAKTADIVYDIQKGPKIFVEKIVIKGNIITHDKVIRREMQIMENAPYNQSAIDLSKRRLVQLGYFSEVNVATPRGSRDDLIDLVIEVKEKPTGSFSIGAGFSSLESFIFNASIQKDNFFGRGLKGGVMANISKLRQEFAFNATDRYFLDTRWITSLNVHRYSSALNRDFDQKSFGGALTFGREVFPFFDASVGYNIEDVTVTNFSSQVPAFFQQNASGLTSSVLSTLAYDTRDNRIFTTKGMYNAVSGEYAGHGVGGDNDYWKMQAESRVFFKMPWKTVLKARGLFAYVNSLSSDPVPLFERFFLGGVNTLRGFDFNSIGPSLSIPSSATGGDHDFTYGGNRMMMFNLEYEVPLYDPAGIRAVIFADTGQSYAETESIDILRFRSDYGFGLRWNSPFGPLRFEWGFPIKKREGESFTVFNFTIGQSF